MANSEFNCQCTLLTCIIMISLKLSEAFKTYNKILLNILLYLYMCITLRISLYFMINIRTYTTCCS